MRAPAARRLRRGRYGRRRPRRADSSCAASTAACRRRLVARARRVGLQLRELELLFKEMDLEFDVRQVPPVCCSGLLAVAAEAGPGRARRPPPRRLCCASSVDRWGCLASPHAIDGLPLCAFSSIDCVQLMLASRKTLAIIEQATSTAV